MSRSRAAAVILAVAATVLAQVGTYLDVKLDRCTWHAAFTSRPCPTSSQLSQPRLLGRRKARQQKPRRLCAHGDTLPSVLVKDSGEARGNILVVEAEVRRGQLVCRDQGVWVMREGEHFTVQRTQDGRTRFQYHQGSQTVIDGFCALPAEDRERVLQLYCPPAPSDALRMRFGAAGERIGQLLRIPPDISTADAWKALQIFQRNAQATEVSDGKYIVAMYPVLSRICHSCAPNVDYEVAGDGVLKVTAKQDLNVGQELVQSYLTDAELAWPASRRQEKTSRVWGFTCDCARCQAAE